MLLEPLHKNTVKLINRNYLAANNMKKIIQFQHRDPTNEIGLIIISRHPEIEQTRFLKITIKMTFILMMNKAEE